MSPRERACNCGGGMTAVSVVVLVAAVAFCVAVAIYGRRLHVAHAALIAALQPLATGDLTAKISTPAGRRGAEVADLVSAVAERLSRVLTQVELTRSQLSTGWHD